MRKDFTFPSCGAGSIYVNRWQPKSDPRLIVQIIHGIADYGQRYDDFAQYLADMGCLVVADDHMGHGLSTGKDGIIGYFTGGWFSAVDDCYQLYRMTHEEFPDVPYVLFGHSMGSFMAQTMLQKYPDSQVDACVLCGSGWQADIAISAGVRLCDVVCRRFGETEPNAKILKLVFGAYNLRVERPRTPYDWVCRDARIVDRLIEDPLCSHAVTVGLMRDMLSGINYIQTTENMNRINKALPILLVSGGDDPVGSYGDGVRRIGDNFTALGIKDVTVKIFPLCRHEILNEINKHEVYHFVAGWMFQKCDI